MKKKVEKMKRVAAFVLALVMVMPLVGCSGKKEQALKYAHFAIAEFEKNEGIRNAKDIIVEVRVDINDKEEEYGYTDDDEYKVISSAIARVHFCLQENLTTLPVIAFIGEDNAVQFEYWFSDQELQDITINTRKSGEIDVYAIALAIKYRDLVNRRDAAFPPDSEIATWQRIDMSDLD